MLRTTTSKLVVLGLTLGLAMAILGLVLGDPHLRLPGQLEEAWRTLAAMLAGVTVMLVVLVAWAMAGIRVDPADGLTRPLGAHVIGHMILVVYVGTEMVRLLGEPYITWRTPTATVGLAVAMGSLALAYRRVRRLVLVARETGAVVKLTLMDTGKPGPDVDLDHVATIREKEAVDGE